VTRGSEPQPLRAGRRTLLLALVSIVSTGALTGQQPPAQPCDPGNGDITLPPGFCATVFTDLAGATRHLSVASNGDVFVSLGGADGVTQIGRLRPDHGSPGVLMLRDTDHDGHADAETRVAVANPATGIAVHGSWLYVSTRNAIERFPFDLARFGSLGQPEILVSGFPGGGHASKSLAFDDNGGLFVSVASYSNACSPNATQAAPDPCPELPERAGIWRYAADRLGQVHPRDGERWATGVRNGLGLYWHAGLHALFATSHGRDSLSSLFPAIYTIEKNADTPSEEFVRIEKGADLGWPYCYHDRQLGRMVLAPEYGGDGSKAGRCAGTATPLVGFPGHWAPNDMMFYTGAMFPTHYRDGAFIAFHGSWNRQPLPEDGYNVVFQPMRAGAPSGPFEVFADGFASNEKEPVRAMHRPTGLAQGPDGALYIADDMRGRIWRVTYAAPVR
jgi:glucose/arabinose dehydrogenase